MAIFGPHSFIDCIHHTIKRLKEVVYLDAVGQAAGFYKVVLTLRQIGFTGLALQDNGHYPLRFRRDQ